MKKSIIAISLTVFSIACTSSTETKTNLDEVEYPEGPLKFAKVQLQSKSGSSITGEIEFTEANGIVSMLAKIEGASPGEHAIHIHAKGDCSADDGTSAGGHWNPLNYEHGKWGTDSFHRGDIGNIMVGEDGVGEINRDTDLWCIGCMDAEKNILGKAIIVHEGPDDFTSQPAGAAGPRVACGEILLNE